MAKNKPPATTYPYSVILSEEDALHLDSLRGEGLSRIPASHVLRNLVTAHRTRAEQSIKSPPSDSLGGVRDQIVHIQLSVQDLLGMLDTND